MTSAPPSHTSPAGGWWTPLGPPTDQPERASSPRAAPPANWIPPVDQFRLGERPAHRRRSGRLNRLRLRAHLLLGVSAAAAVPLVLGMVEAPSAGLRPEIGGGPPPAYANPVPSPADSARPFPGGRGPTTHAPSRASRAEPSVSPLPTPVGPAALLTSGAPPPPVPSTSCSIKAEGTLAERHGAAVPRELASVSGGWVVAWIGCGPGWSASPPSSSPRTATTRSPSTTWPRSGYTPGSSPTGGAEWSSFRPPAASGAPPARCPSGFPSPPGVNTVQFGNRNHPTPDLDRMIDDSPAAAHFQSGSTRASTTLVARHSCLA